MRDSLRKYLAAATLLVLPIIAACGEDIMPPPPTGSIVGQVSIEGMGIDGVSVSLSNGASTATAGGGNYRFDNVEQNSYTVTISGYPADASFDQTSAPASIGDTGGTVTVDFRGTYIRTAAIMGTVTVENMGLGGVTVSLSGMGEGQTTTDDSGQYSFSGLRAGTYSVEISSFDANEVGFSSTSGAATVGVGESKVVSFDGTYLRTAGIQGQVSVEGAGLQGVTVTLVGQGEDRSEMTNASGQYAFSQLRSGDYQVAISGYDTDDYEFATTSKSVSIATGETANVPFEGTLLRTAGISGRVSLDDGMGLDGVEVRLAGGEFASTTSTANGGQYSFAGLAAGTYVLSITNPDENAYNFTEEEMTKNVTLMDDQSAIVNFSGTHTRTAMISGTLFIDEVMPDKMHNNGEPSITVALAPWLGSLADDDPARAAVAGALAKAKVKLRGPDLNTMTDIDIMPDGTFSTGAALMKGSYQVELPVNDDTVAAGLAAAGVAFVGESAVVSVDAGASATVNFPFRITMQTVATGARMGVGDSLGVAVPGVKLALYARADGTDMLGEATTDDDGMASFTFARAGNTGPGGNDNIVFVKAMDSGHKDLMVSGNELVEIAYASTARLYAADHDDEVATLVNVAVAFDFWVKSDEDARDGDMGLGGWQVQYCMPKAGTGGASAVVCTGDDAAFHAIMMGEGDDAEELTSDTTMATRGKASFATRADPAMLPAMFYVRATPVDDDGDSVQPDMGEKWEQSDALMHSHTGLDLPPGEGDDMTDLGPIRVTFTTQSIYVGVHRELDDRTGYTDYIGVGDGDARPSDEGHANNEGAGKITIKLMIADSRGRLEPFEYDHDANPKNDDEEAEATVGKTGMVSFKNIPTDTEITVVASADNDMVIVPDSRHTREIDAFGDQLDDYPDGVIVGAFGDMGGARPDVWLCPLQRQADDDPAKYCSTYAYKWKTGKIEGTISGLDKGDKAEVTLTPVNSNDDYADDLEKETTVTSTGAATTKYSFASVADGRYRVTLAAKAGSWQEDETDRLSVEHAEDSDDEDYPGASVSGTATALSATNLRGVIRGRIANDSNNRSGLTSDESRAGVTVAIYTAKKVGGSGTTKDNYVTDKAVTDAAGDPLMAETDGDGVYMFEGLTRSNWYIVKPQETDLYTAVRNGNTKIGRTAEKATDVVTHALVEAGSPPKPGSEPGIPTWNYNTSKATVGAADFVLLYKDGEVEGKVSDPSVRAAHSRTDIELLQCKTTNYRPADTEAGTAEVPLSECDEYTGVEVVVSVDAKGNWSADDLREGIYEVHPDPPAGYVVSDSVGTTTGITDAHTSYHEMQIVELMGGRADDDTETFHIKDRNAEGDAALDGTTIEVKGKTTVECTPAVSPTNATPQCGHSEDGSFSVVITASDDATIRISSSATDPAPTGSTNYSQAVTNGKATTVTLPKPGTRTYFIHIAAEDGYATNTAADLGFSIRRDADVRVKTVELEWSGAEIVLDREELGVNADVEEHGTVTTLRVTVDKADNGVTAVPETALTVLAAGMTSGFSQVGWADAETDGTCPSDVSGTDNTVTLDANTDTTKGTDTVCFRITDSDGAGTDPDINAANTETYRLIVTRK